VREAVWVERSLIEAMGFALFAEMFYVTGEESGILWG